MQSIDPGQVVFRIHGVPGDGDVVPGLVFATRLAALVRALREADRAANGILTHDYRIAKLKSSTPTVILAEYRRAKHSARLDERSGIQAFDDCVGAIAAGERDRALTFGRCARQVSALARGSEKQFGYGEVWTGAEKVIRIDPFLAERAEAVVHPEKSKAVTERGKWFKGIAVGSFDGYIKAVDLRGALPQVKLVLSAGQKEIDCILRGAPVAQLKEILDQRVRIEGRALYDGKSGLPRRIEAISVSPIKAAGDFTRWRGAFAAFEPPEWVGDDE